MSKPSRFPGPQSGPLLKEMGGYVIAEPFPFVVDLAGSHRLVLRTLEGDELVDWTGMYGSRLLSFNHPRLQEPEYLRRLGHAANAKPANPDFLTPECLAYYRLLHRLAPAGMRSDKLEVYALNSGAEAVENMMKYFINLHDQRLLKAGKPIRARRFIYFDEAFHGRTVFTLNITRMRHDPVATKDFHGIIPTNRLVPFPAYNGNESEEDNRRRVDFALQMVEAALVEHGDEVVGMIVEPLQGAGGHRTAMPAFFQGLSRLAHQYGVYLGFDEVQTAGGQTGSVFAIDEFDLPYPPQAVASAKKFANGVIYMLHPMDDMGVLDSTWGGTLADMVRFVEEWKIVEEEDLIGQVPTKTAQLNAGLEALLDRFGEFACNRRGMGLYQGFSLRDPAHVGRMLDIALEQENLLLLPAGTDAIRLRPVLDVTAAEIDDFLGRLERCFETLAAEAKG